MLSYLNKASSIINLVKHFLNSIPDTLELLVDYNVGLKTDGAPDVISQALLYALVWGNEQINGFVCNRLMQNPAKFYDFI